MDICVLNPFFYPYLGGTERVLYHVYKRLAKRHNVTVISSAFESDNRTHTEEIEGIKVVRLKTKYMAGSVPGMPMPFLSVEGLNDRIAKENADIYHINNQYLYFWGTVSAIKVRKKRMVLTLHNSMPKNIDALTDISGLAYELLWGRRLLSYCDAITGVSEDAITSTVPPGLRHKAHVIFNGVDCSVFRKLGEGDSAVRSAIEEMGGEQRIINVARLVPQKGQMYLLRALAALKKDGYKGASLFIVGGGPMKEQVLAEAKRLGVSDSVRIKYGINEETMPYYYNASTAAVLPSLYEPAGLALLESLACEVPTIATRVGGIPEMMKSTGYYVADRDADGIKERLEEVFSDPEAARVKARRARELMLKEHDWEVIAQKYERLFEKLLR